MHLISIFFTCIAYSHTWRDVVLGVWASLGYRCLPDQGASCEFLNHVQVLCTESMPARDPEKKIRTYQNSFHSLIASWTLGFADPKLKILFSRGHCIHCVIYIYNINYVRDYVFWIIFTYFDKVDITWLPISSACFMMPLYLGKAIYALSSMGRRWSFPVLPALSCQLLFGQSLLKLLSSREDCHQWLPYLLYHVRNGNVVVWGESIARYSLARSPGTWFYGQYPTCVNMCCYSMGCGGLCIM